MATVDRELNERITALSARDKRRVLEYVRGLELPPPNLKPGTDLLRFGGSIPREVLDEMQKLLEEDCEKINRGGW